MLKSILWPAWCSFHDSDKKLGDFFLPTPLSVWGGLWPGLILVVAWGFLVLKGFVDFGEGLFLALAGACSLDLGAVARGRAGGRGLGRMVGSWKLRGGGHTKGQKNLSE